MKKSLQYSFLPLALILLLIWTSCSKSSSSNGSNRTTIITTGTWKYDTAGIDLDRNGTIDIGDSTIPSCYKDNSYQFNKDSTGIGNNGASLCNAGDPQTYPFEWSFGGTNQSTIKSDADPELAQGINIHSMTDTKIVLYKDTTVLGVSIWYILQLKH